MWLEVRIEGNGSIQHLKIIFTTWPLLTWHGPSGIQIYPRVTLHPHVSIALKINIHFCFLFLQNAYC